MPIDPTDERFVNRAIEATIRISLVAALVAWCFTIVRPFVGPVAWATIIAVAVHPVYVSLRADWISFHRRLGVAGTSVARAASGSRASLIAHMMAAGVV